MRSLWNTIVYSLFYFISFLMHFHRFCDQNKTQLNRMLSDPRESELVVRTMLIDFTHENKIVHYFHCIGDASASKGWTIMYLIGGDGLGIFFCRNLFSRLKALYEFYFTSLRCISLLCVAMHDFYFFCRHCTGILFSKFANHPQPPSKRRLSVAKQLCL